MPSYLIHTYLPIGAGYTIIATIIILQLEQNNNNNNNDNNYNYRYT